jgi:hypothetical protein
MMSPAEHYARACELADKAARLIRQDEDRYRVELLTALAQVHMLGAAAPWGVFEMANALSSDQP